MILSLKENKIDKLTFEDKDIKEFHEGFLHEIKNLIEGNGKEMLSNLSEKDIRKFLEAGDE